MAKIDYKKQFKSLYHAGNTPTLVEVPPLAYLMMDGQGNPNTAPAYQEAVSTLYKLAYAIRFYARDEMGVDFGVMPLEGLWWVAGLSQFSYTNKDNWYWTMMIMQPEPVTEAVVEAVRPAVAAKHHPPRLPEVRFEVYNEGLSAQIMHHGPYAEEKPTVDRLHAFIQEQGCHPALKHHEIYLSDPNRTAPEKMRTLLRQPVQPN